MAEKCAHDDSQQGADASQTIEQLCQRILDEQGFLVVGTMYSCKIGDLLPDAFGGPWGILRSPLAITSEATGQDLVTQSDRYFPGNDGPSLWPFHYKVTAE